MKRNARWLVTLLVVGGIMAASFVPALAAEAENDLRRLVLENRVAQIIADLRLTPDQKAQLREVAIEYRSAYTAAMEELAELLARRRDALLSGDRQALNEVTQELRELASRRPLASNESVRAFISGLTERQKQVLSQILPGVGLERSFERRFERHAPRLRAREMPRMPEMRWRTPRLEPLPAPDLPRAGAPVVTMHLGLHGRGLEVVDVLIDLLDR